MAYFRCGTSGQSVENDSIPVMNGNNVEFIPISDFSSITDFYVCYKPINLSSIPLYRWIYNNTGLNVPVFQCPRPTDVKSNSAGFLLDGYTSVSSFWDDPSNIKCVASGNSYINFSNNDFNNINDFVNSIQDKVLYMPLI